MNQSDLDKILKSHKLYLEDNLRGERADLSYADLRSADLRSADLSSADLQQCKNVIYAQCSWSNHGECGRQLVGLYYKKEIILFCGCFTGSVVELRKYISNGENQFKKSRRCALNFVLSRLKECIK